MKNGTPKHIPRRPYEDDKPDGYLESDRDYFENNSELILALLENHIKEND